MTGATHYDTLGLRPTASSDDIRDAYRMLARRHHPDRSTGEASEMHAINEAYRVLRDPARRAMYDAGLRGPVRTGGEAATAPTRATHGGRPLLDAPRMPWRTLGIAGLLAVVGVVVLAQFAEPSEPAPPDGILRNGDCVEIEPDNDAREVACSGEGDRVVRAFVAFDGTCPNGTEPHRDGQGMGVACIERPR